MVLKNEKGSGLIMVLVVMAVLMVLATTFLALASTEGKQTARHYKKLQTYHYAMTGVEFAFEILNNNYLEGNLSEGFTDGTFPVYFSGNIKEGIKTGINNNENIMIEILENETELIIKSIGKIDDVDELIYVKIPKSSSDEDGGGNGVGGIPNIPLDQAVVTSGDITLVGSSRIVGGVTVGGNVYTTGTASATGSIKQQTGLTFHMPTFPNYPNGLPQPPNHSPIQNGVLLVGQYPYQHYTINEDGDYSKISIVSNGILDINVGEGTRIIRVKELEIQQGHIRIQGSGKLVIYVEDQFLMNGSMNHFNNVINPQQMTIFYGGNNPIEFNGNDMFAGDLFSKTANITITGGAEFVGNIVTGGYSVSVSGGTKVKVPMLYAPNSIVDIAGGVTIEGRIVAKELTGSGNVDIIYQDGSYNLFPELIWESSSNGTSGGSFGSPIWGN